VNIRIGPGIKLKIALLFTLKLLAAHPEYLWNAKIPNGPIREVIDDDVLNLHVCLCVKLNAALFPCEDYWRHVMNPSVILVLKLKIAHFSCSRM
jgi:hypothetical protein